MPLKHLAKWQWLAYKYNESLEYHANFFSGMSESLHAIGKINITSSYMGESYPVTKNYKTGR